MSFFSPAKFLVLLLLFILLTDGLQPTTAVGNNTIYYIEPTGQDSNDGLSPATPFATIQKCADVAVAGDTCRIRQGIYREQIRPANSGTAEAPITFEAYPNETPLINGARLINENSDGAGTWQQHNATIYKIQLTTDYDGGVGNNQLFVDGEKFIEARWPNMPHPTSIERDDFAISTAGDLGTDLGNDDYESTYQHPGIEGYWDSGYISFSAGKEWWGKHGEVVTAVDGEVTFRFNSGGVSSLPNTIPSVDDPFFLWGRLEALDAPGEFHFDRDGDYGAPNTLYIYATSSPASQQVEIKADIPEHWLNYGIDVSGRSYIDIRGLHFQAARIAANADSRYINIDRIHSEYSGHHWMLNSWSRAPVDLHGEYMQLTNSVIAHSPTAGVQVRGNYNLVENNVLYDLGYIINLSDGIQTSNSTGSIIRHNTIFDTKAIAISAAGLQAGAVTHNRVYNIARRTTDIAAINSWNGGDGQNTEIAYNLVHDVVAYYNQEGEHWGGKGIRLDSGGAPESNSNYIIHHNVVFNTTANGIAFWGVQAPSHPNYNNTGIQIYNNTVVGDIQMVYREGESHQGTIVRNNLTTGEFRYFGLGQTPPGSTITDNFFSERDDLPNNLYGNPQLVSPSNFNLTLQPDSPAVDTAVSIPPFTDGYMGSAPDMGAYEAGEKPFVAGALLLPEHLAQLELSCTAVQCTISNLPIGYHIPFDFVLRLGNNDVTTCTNGLDVHTNSYYANCPVNLSAGTLPVAVSLDGQTFVPLSGDVEVTALSITAIDPAFVPVNETTTVTITGTNFVENDRFKTPITFSNLTYGDVTERPVPLVVDTAQLISAGHIAIDCSDIGFANGRGEAIYNYWLESGCNNERTLIWLVQKPATDLAGLPYHVNFLDESQIYLTRDEMSQSDLTAVFPVLAKSSNALWLAANDLTSFAENASIPNWPSRTQTDLVSVAQSDPNAQPSFAPNQANGWPSVFFDGGTDGTGDTYHLGDALGGDTHGGVFIVYHNPDPGDTNWQRIYSAGQPEDGADYLQGAAFYIPPTVDNSGPMIPQITPTLHTNHYPSTTWDGVPRDPTDFRNFRIAQHNINTIYYRGYLTELIAFTEDITQAERDVVGQYLTAKYNLAGQNLQASIAYDETAQGLAVQIGDNPCTDVDILSTTQLTCTVPAQPDEKLESVHVQNGWAETATLPFSFTYGDAPIQPQGIYLPIILR